MNLNYGIKKEDGHHAKLDELVFNPRGVILNKTGSPNESYWTKEKGLITISDHENKDKIEFFLKNEGYYLTEDGSRYLSTRNNIKPKYKLLVASHVDYISKTDIKQEVARAGFTNEDVYYVLSGSETDQIVDNKIHLSLNYWEYGALFASTYYRGNDVDYWFLIHDTCLLGPNFKEKLDNFDMTHRFDVIALNEQNQFNIGFYKHEFLLKNKEYLCSLHGITKEEGIKIELDASIRKKSNFTSCIHTGEIFSKKKVKVWGETERLEYYIPEIDLYKYLAYIGKPSEGFFGKHNNTP